MFLCSTFGLVMFGGVSLVYYLLTKRVGLGEGDIKLMTMMGFFIGLKGALFVTLLGGITGALVGTIYLMSSGKGMRDPIPFGPFLSSSAVIFILLPDKFLQYIFPFSVPI